MTPTTTPAHTNRLIDATSPYLQQHAHNPVDWHEWGPEALEKARQEQKPIFLSIGYSACHWCHVMAHESFEDEATAAVMNLHFINIKVDREERPDLDEIYMRATVLYTRGHGGWPMSVWLTPDLKPFAAGTYFPPTSRFGRPGFRELCERIGELWQVRRDDLEDDAARIADAVARQLDAQRGNGDRLTRASIDQAADVLAGAFDHVRGGIASGNTTNKFPPSMALDLMLRSLTRKGADSKRHERLLGLVRLTLDKMARGGIFDQLGGGIHRYSTDQRWLVPHFEKMLYDQALVSRIYIDAHQLTKDAEYARVARSTFDYVLDDLQSPAGGFYSTRDADSEGEEGKYYVWTKAEIGAALGPDDGEPFCSYYDVTDAGNWDDPHAPGVSRNILNVPRELETVAKLHQLERDDLARRLDVGRQKLRELRGRRVPPHRDEKILCEWNGMMIASLARGGAVLGERRYIDAAARAADFILDKQYANGRLLRSYRDGHRLQAAFLSDYACMIDGLLELYEATFEKRWFATAVELNNVVCERFWDAEHGGFFFAAHDHETLIARSKEVRDGAVPSGNSVQLLNLLRLSVMLGDDRLRQMAEQSMATFASELLNAAGTGERFLCGVEFALCGPVEIAVVGDAHAAATQTLLAQIHQTYLPNRILMLHNPARPTENVESPLLQDRPLVDGRPAVYVCRNYTCQLPATTPDELARQLAE